MNFHKRIHRIFIGVICTLCVFGIARTTMAITWLAGTPVTWTATSTTGNKTICVTADDMPWFPPYSKYDDPCKTDCVDITVTNIIYVDVDATGRDNGACWTDAFDTIQEGIDAANCDGLEIQVAEGTYTEAIDFNGKGITLTGTDPCDWTVVAATIIDGDGAGAAVTMGSGCDANSILTGITITNGNVGIVCTGTGSQISRCIIEDNSYDGINLANSPIVSNNIIAGNDNRGILCTSGIQYVENNLIYENATGIWTYWSSAEITNNTIADNTSYGIYRNGPLSITVANCIIWDCNDDLFDCSATYSDIQDGDAGTGNISTDPNFVDAVNDDYKLDGTGDCIDAADGSVDPTYDIDFDARYDDLCTTDTGYPDPCYVDMGAYEYQG